MSPVETVRPTMYPASYATGRDMLCMGTETGPIGSIEPR